MRLPEVFFSRPKTAYYEPFDAEVSSKTKLRFRPTFTTCLIGMASASILMLFALYQLTPIFHETTTTKFTDASTMTTTTNRTSITSDPSVRTYPCGTSLAEAYAAGCIFDPLTVYWLPSRCSTLYADDFLQAASIATTSDQMATPDTAYKRSIPLTIEHEGKWPYYSHLPGDPLEHTPTLLDLSTVEIDTPYYTTHGEHLTHCAYMLIRLAHLVSSGETHKMDRMTSHFEHSRHCTLMMLDAARESSMWNRIDSWGEVRSGDC